MAEIHAVEEAIMRFHATLRENEEVRLKLERLATTDGLTGLPNRRHFLGLASDEMARARRYGRPITVGIADLDHFKQVNDRFGHGVGDQVLQRFASVVLETLRETDRVGRLGVRSLPSSSPKPCRTRRCSSRGACVSAWGSLPWPCRMALLAVTASFGLADATGQRLEESLAQADAALYEAKGGGRDRSVLATRAEAEASPQRV
jgi:diguanylate cyclase (GGDEF)-like protein